MKVNEWLLNPAERPGAQVTMVMLHHSGGSASVFVPWARMMPSSIEAWLVELPGHGGRMSEAAIDRFQPLAEALATALRPATSRRYVFFGHSMGAMLAFEVAKRFARDGVPLPDRLFLSAFKEPANFVKNRIKRAHLNDVQLLEYIKSLGGTPLEVLENRDLISMMMPVIRADYGVLDSYEPMPAPKLACPFTVFGGIADKGIPFEALSAWDQHTASGSKLIPVPGAHFFLHEHRAKLIRQITEDLGLPEA